jgi:NADH-quinone oxidoreductase subunit J
VTARDIVFAVIGVIASVSAILAVTTRNVVHAALWLVVCLGTIAGCYVVLGAELIALVQVLIYVGAVVVLVLFALMLTRAPIGPNREITSPWWQRLLAVVLAVSVAVLLAATLVPLVGEGALESKNGDTTAVSTAVFGTWVWPFELLSVLLLAALIGAFALAKIAGAGLVRRPRRRRSAPAPMPPPPTARAAAAEDAEPPATAAASTRESSPS